MKSRQKNRNGLTVKFNRNGSFGVSVSGDEALFLKKSEFVLPEICGFQLGIAVLPLGQELEKIQ